MLKVFEKFPNPLSLVINRRASLFKNEDQAYLSSFLSSVRNKMLPYHSQSLSKYPTNEELNKMYLEIYNEINELYIDEHMTMGNNDYLEQCYDIFSNIHKLVRKYEIVYDIKLDENRKKFNQNNPDQFPVYNLTGSDSVPDYKTIWELNKDFNTEFEELTGHTLLLKNSKIEHPDSGKGVFISCKNRKFILPGTLLGFYPGSVNWSFINPPKLEVNSTYPYLKRYNGIWIDPFKRIPYPLKPYFSLDEFYLEEEAASFITGSGDSTISNINVIPISYLNPLSFGHKINHPPPDTSPNVRFLDISIPFNFFPSEFLRYLPNIYEVDDKKITDKNKLLRAVGIISLSEIKHNEELYVDYIEEDLIPHSYKPDWLLQPPPRNPYLIKKNYITRPSIIDEITHKIYLLTFGKENVEFQKYIKREEGLNITRANFKIKKIQYEIREVAEQLKLVENGKNQSDDHKLLNN